jgi:hypothetical protein
VSIDRSGKGVRRLPRAVAPLNSTISASKFTTAKPMACHVAPAVCRRQWHQQDAVATSGNTAQANKDMAPSHLVLHFSPSLRLI